MLLPALKAGDGALIHEVVPAADREAGHVHLVEVQRTIFVSPVVVVVRMRHPFLQQPIIVGRHTTVCLPAI